MALRDRLHQAWHSPRSGPVILVVLGLPLLGFAIAMALFPVLLAADAVRGLPMARHPAWFTAVMSAAWLLVILLVLRLRAIGRANRGLDVSVSLRQRGRPASPVVLAARLGTALSVPGVVVGEALREDYGAGLWVAAGGERLWLSVSGEGGRDCVAGLVYDPGFDLKRRLSHRVDRVVFARLSAALQAAIDADPALQRA